MGAMRVTIDGGFDPTTGLVVHPLPVSTSTGGTPGTASFVQITDGTDNASINPGTNGMPSTLEVSIGSLNSAPTLNAVTANATGATIDAGSAHSNWTGVAEATGSPTAGTLTLELSLDANVWVSSTVTASVTAAGNFLLASTGRAARYARVNLTGLTGTITLTVQMMAAG